MTYSDLNCQKAAVVAELCSRVWVHYVRHDFFAEDFMKKQAWGDLTGF